jgi:hypothetical protein
MESGATNLEGDLNNIRSMINYLGNVQTGSWYDVIATPSTLETGSVRGVDDLNDALHVVEKKRVIRDVHNLIDVTVGGSDNWVILGAGELPAQTDAAVGAVTTLGTVCAFNASFGTNTLDEVAGSSAVSPKNLCVVVDGATRDTILSSERVIYGLFQTETVTDGHTITDTTTTRAQLSFVRINATGDDLEACPAGDIQGKDINYSSRERVRLEDLNEMDFLRGAIVDVSAGGTTDRDAAYVAQGATAVDVTTNSILDLEGAGLTWSIRDDLEAELFKITEGSAGGTSVFLIDTAVDTFDVNAILNNFNAGISANTGATRPINVGVADGIISSTAGALEVFSTADLQLHDGNRSGSTWSLTDGVKLTDTSAEWSTFESDFGEVSLMNAISQASTTGGTPTRSKVEAIMTADAAADVDINNTGGPTNTDVALAPFNNVTFVDDVEVFVNGILQRNGVNAAANDDVYPGTSPTNGDLKFEFALKGTGNVDVLTVIVNGQ